MNLSDLSPTAIAQLGDKLKTLLEGTELSAIESHVRALLLASIGTKPETLATQDATAETLRDQASSAIAERDDTYASLLEDCKQVRDNLKAGRASKAQFEVCGFDFPSSSRTPYIAQIPSDLAVEGFSNGVNKGKFKGNNKSSAVMYEVYRREGDEGDWMLRMAVKPPRFVDEGVTPGQYYEYKVRARASSNVSLFSNSAVVYGLGAAKPVGA